jgi:hypothetical protein
LQPPIYSEKRIADESFELVKEISEKKDVQELNQLLQQAKWKSKVVNMGYASERLYRLLTGQSLESS